MPKPPNRATPGRAARAKPRYQPHPMLAHGRSVAAKLEEATGRSMEAWIAVARRDGPAKERDCCEWLRTEHGLGRMHSMWVAHRARSEQDPADHADPATLVDALYAGPRAALRPVHESVVDAVIAAGDEAVVTACKTMVPVYRKHVFAELRPVEGAVEVQLALGDVPAKGRLEASGRRAAGERMTHRVLVRSAREVDGELRAWIARAYANGAKPMSRGTTEIETPTDVAKALRASKPATATWGACTPAMRRDFLQWITSAKQAETRSRRIAQAVAKLAAGKRRMY